MVTVFLDAVGTTGAAALAWFASVAAFVVVRVATGLPTTAVRAGALADLPAPDFAGVFARAALALMLVFATAFLGAAFFAAATFVDGDFAAFLFVADARLVSALAGFADFFATGFVARAAARTLDPGFFVAGFFTTPARRANVALAAFALPDFVVLAAM